MTRRLRKHATGWTGNVRAREVGCRLRVVPFWEAPYAPPDRINLIIDPGPSFGAGDHATTLMAIELVEEAMALTSPTKPAPSMLDVGTGTGVLAIAARKLGAGFTVGLDIDSSAVFTARRNLGLNRVLVPRPEPDGPTCVLVGGIEAVRGTFDLVAANLAAPLLLRISSDICARTGSFLVLSGIAEAMRNSVFDHYVAMGLSPVRTLEREGWAAALWKRAL
ncbi:MAG: 50S ribosomal protein L11 methyltransferase [Thermodesulfobacteriota bacterium]